MFNVDCICGCPANDMLMRTTALESLRSCHAVSGHAGHLLGTNSEHALEYDTLD